MVNMTEEQVALQEAKVAKGRCHRSEGDQELARDAAAVPDGEENDLHDRIIGYCNRRGWIPLHGSTAHRTKRMPGEPDFEIIADGGRVFFVECKSKSGTLSEAQEIFIARAAALGTKVHVIRSLAEFIVLTNR